MIKYIGSKRMLVPQIVQIVRGVAEARSVIDLFSGTSRVGHALKAAGFQVFANDHNAYAAALARCYVQADAEDVLADARRLVGELNALPGIPRVLHRDLLREVAVLPAEERRAHRRHPRGHRGPGASSPSSRRCCSSR